MTVVYFLDSCRRRRHYPLVVAEAAAADGLGLRPAAVAAAAATFQLLLNDELLENGKNTPVGRVLRQLMDGLLVLAESSFTGEGAADADVLVTGVFVVALSSSPSIASRLGFTFPARLLTRRRRRTARLVMSAGVDKCT